MTRLVSEDLVKHYHGRTVVDHVGVSVDNGEVVGLLGPNGAGKTTCFYMIAGLIPSDAGRVLLAGTDITYRPMHVRARHGLGYLAQEPSVFRRLTVAENLIAVLETRRNLNRQQCSVRCDGLLEEFGLQRLRNNLAHSLSGGERRRLEIARALAVEPRFILLDEPFAGVDPISVTDIQQIIQNLAAQGIGVLITDHNARETLRICARAYIIDQGRVLTEGKPDELQQNAMVREVYLGEQFRL